MSANRYMVPGGVGSGTLGEDLDLIVKRLVRAVARQHAREDDLLEQKARNSTSNSIVQGNKINAVERVRT